MRVLIDCLVCVQPFLATRRSILCGFKPIAYRKDESLLDDNETIKMLHGIHLLDVSVKRRTHKLLIKSFISFDESIVTGEHAISISNMIGTSPFVCRLLKCRLSHKVMHESVNGIVVLSVQIVL